MVILQLNRQISLLPKRPLTHYWTAPLKGSIWNELNILINPVADPEGGPAGAHPSPPKKIVLINYVFYSILYQNVLN